MTRILVILALLLAPNIALARTYRCTGTNADAAAIDALLAKGGAVYLKGDLAHCHINATLMVTVPGTYLYGDGPASIPVTDTAHSALSPYAQKIAASSGPATIIDADVPTMTTAPFNMIEITTQGFYVGYLTVNSHYDQIAAPNTGGVSNHMGGGVYAANGSANGLVDHVDIENSGGDGFDNQDSLNIGLVNSVVNHVWHNSAYTHGTGNTAAKLGRGMYVLSSVLAVGSQSNIPGVPGTGYDGIDCDPDHSGCIAAFNTLLGDDLLLDAHPNKSPPEIGTDDVLLDNYTDNSSVTPSCGAIEFGGTPVLGETITIIATLAQPTTNTGPATWTYTVTSADMAASSPIGSVLTNLGAVMNAAQITGGGVPMVANVYLYAKPGIVSIGFSMVGDTACSATFTASDSAAPSGLTTAMDAFGNGGAGCAEESGAVGPYWVVGNVCTHSRNYCDVSGGPNYNGHIIGNVCRGSTTTSYKISSVDETGAGGPTGAPTGGDVIGNTIYTPNPELPIPNIGVLVSYSTTCDSMKFSGAPTAAGETITTIVTLLSPSASNSPATYPYTVTAADIAASIPLASVVANIAAMMQASPITPSGGKLSAVATVVNGAQTIRFTLSGAQLCSMTTSLSDSSSSVTAADVAGTTGLGSSLAYGNIGGVQTYPPVGQLFFGGGNTTGNYP